MKRILMAGNFGVVALMATALVLSKPTILKTTAIVRADEGAPCSLATVAGNYGLTLTGTLLLPTGSVPAAIGRATAGAEGNVFGTEARSVGGGFANETFTGTQSVNPDCTGTATLQFFESGQLVRTSVLSTVFDDNSNEERIIQHSLTLPGGTSIPGVITAESRKLSPAKSE